MIKKIYGSLFFLWIMVPLQAVIFDECVDSTIITSKNVRDVCGLYTIALKETKDALADWSLQILETFNGNAGDVACHVATAHILSLLSLESDVMQGYAQQCVIADQKIKKLLKQKIEIYVPINFESFLKEYGINHLACSKDIEFLTVSHFVTKYYSSDKKIGYQKAKKLAHTYGIPFSKAKNLIKEARTKLNECNCAYIKELADAVSGECAGVACALEFVHEHQGIKTRSAYCAFKTIYDYLSANQVPVVLNVSVIGKSNGKQLVKYCVPMLYIASKPGGALSLCDPKTIDLSQACYVSDAYFDTTGESKNYAHRAWKKKMGQMPVVPDVSCAAVQQLKEHAHEMDFKELWLSQAATHPQFVGAGEMDFASIGKAGEVLADEFNYYKKRDKDRAAFEETVLYLVHDYPSTLRFFY